jgi:hypothetical protein
MVTGNPQDLRAAVPHIRDGVTHGRQQTPRHSPTGRVQDWQDQVCGGAVLRQLGLVPSHQANREDSCLRKVSGTQAPILGPGGSASECYKLHGPNLGAV